VSILVLFDPQTAHFVSRRRENRASFAPFGDRFAGLIDSLSSRCAMLLLTYPCALRQRAPVCATRALKAVVFKGKSRQKFLIFPAEALRA